MPGNKKSNRKDLGKIARAVFDMTMREDPDTWRPITADIRETFDLNDEQAQKVKQYAKAIGDHLGIVWGWDPAVDYFRPAPHKMPEVAMRILEYSQRHWANGGKSANYIVSAAYRQGYLPKTQKDEMQRRNRAAAKQIISALEDVRLRKDNLKHFRGDPDLVN